MSQNLECVEYGALSIYFIFLVFGVLEKLKPVHNIQFVYKTQINFYSFVLPYNPFPPPSFASFKSPGHLK